MKFKVGDVVERVESSWNGMKVGDKGEVFAELHGVLWIKGFNSRADFDRDTNGHADWKFKLVCEQQWEND